MDDFISREALRKELLEKSFYPAIVKRALEKAPAANVTPVVNAAWIWYEDIPTNSEFEDMAECGWKCSACEQYPDGEDRGIYYDDYERPPRLKFCPNCGAKMDGGST